MTQFEMCICCCKVCFYLQSSLPSWHAVWCADRWEFEGELKQEPDSSKKRVIGWRKGPVVCYVSFHAPVKAEQYILCSSLPLWLAGLLAVLT